MCKFVLFVSVILTVLAINILAVPAPSIDNFIIGTVESALRVPLEIVQEVLDGAAL